MIVPFVIGTYGTIKLYHQNIMLKNNKIQNTSNKKWF